MARTEEARRETAGSAPGRRRRRRVRGVFDRCVSAILGVLLLACAPEAANVEAAPRNLLLLTIDTLRADRLGFYGYDRPTSPNLDRLAAEAAVFDSAHSSSSWTLPGLATLMTGLYTSTHGCWDGRSVLPPVIPTLAGRLRESGYDTAAIVSHFFLDPRYGLDQGFDSYDDDLVTETRAASHLAITSPSLADKAIAWLEGRPIAEAKPWFLWVHFFDPHERYLVHPGVSEAFGTERPADRYDGEIAFTDLHVGRVLDRLAALGLLDSTLVIVTSDHGEEFGDHGGRGHRATLYGEVQRVPLLIRSPGIEPGHLGQDVSLADIAPTVLELLLAEPLQPVAGVSLAPLLRGEKVAPQRAVLGELGGALLRTQSIVRDQWKLVVDHEKGRRQLFDLTSDPAELQDRAREEPARVAELNASLQAEVKRARGWQRRLGSAGNLELSPEDRERLRELGYVED